MLKRTLLVLAQATNGVTCLLTRWKNYMRWLLASDLSAHGSRTTPASSTMTSYRPSVRLLYVPGL